jgi:Trk-type K+ transport system membrane component
MKRKKGILVLILALLLTQYSEAQCAMCRAAIESNGNNAVAEGINNGIVYLMAIPYILVAALFYLVYRKVKT